MPRDLLPMPALFHPDSCEPEIFAFAGIWHPTAPNDGFSASDNHDIAVDPEVLDLPVERCDDKKAGINHSQNLLLRNKLVQRVSHDEIVRPQTCHGRAIVFQKSIDLFRVQPSNPLFSGVGTCIRNTYRA